MNWIAFGWTLLGCAGSAAAYFGIAFAVHGAHHGKPVKVAAGIAIVMVDFSAFIGFITAPGATP